MTQIRGPLARLDRSREELAKAWLVRSDRARLARGDQRSPYRAHRARAAGPDQRHGRTRPPPDVVQAVRAERRADPARGRPGGPARRSRRLARRRSRATSPRCRRCSCARCTRSSPTATPTASPRPSSGCVDAGGAIQAAALDELVRARSRTLETQANTDALTGLHNLRYFQRQLGGAARVLQALQASLLRAADGRRRAQAHQRRARPPGRRPAADAGRDVAAALGPHDGHRGAPRRRRVLRARARAGRQERPGARRAPGRGDRRGGRDAGRAAGERLDRRGGLSRPRRGGRGR